MGEAQDRPVYRVLSTRTIVVSAIALVMVGAGTAAWLLLAFGGGIEADRARLEAIKAAGTIVVGTGGAAALWLAARRQQTTEIALRQRDIDQAHQEQVAAATQAHQERVATATETDAAERRLTELYTKAVEQLGSNKAPVRLGGMYALERLAQNVPDQRQTIVNVLCAYLRIPYTPPSVPTETIGEAIAEDSATPTATTAIAIPSEETVSQEQEYQVHLTAERILFAHLKAERQYGPESRLETFWKDIDLDLAGATLLEADLDSCHISSARFSGANFVGLARFDGARFDSYSDFSGAIFSSDCSFNVATFNRATKFKYVEFKGEVDLSAADFEGEMEFSGYNFRKDANFRRSSFSSDAFFDGVTLMEASILLM